MFFTHSPLTLDFKAKEVTLKVPGLNNILRTSLRVELGVTLQVDEKGRFVVHVILPGRGGTTDELTRRSDSFLETCVIHETQHDRLNLDRCRRRDPWDPKRQYKS